MEQEEKRLEESRDTNVQQMNNSEKGTVAARGFRPVIVRRSGARERVAAEAATEQKGDQSVHKRRFMLAPTLALPSFSCWRSADRPEKSQEL